MSALKYLSDFPKRRYQLWCPLSLLFSGYQKRFSRGQKPPNLAADLCDLVSRSRMTGSEHLLPLYALMACTGAALLADAANWYLGSSPSAPDAPRPLDWTFVLPVLC